MCLPLTIRTMPLSTFAAIEHLRSYIIEQTFLSLGMFLPSSPSLLRSPRSRLLACNPQPHLHGLIVACRGEALAIGGPCHAQHNISMLTLGEQVLPTASTPHPHGPIEACRGEALAIGGPPHAEHNISMPTVGEQGLPATGIPHLHGPVPACGGEVRTIRGPCHAGYSVSMPVVGEQGGPARGIPHP